MKYLDHRIVVRSALIAALALAGCATQPAQQPVASVSSTLAAAQATPAAADAARLVPVQGALNVRTFANLKGRHGAIPASSFIRAADLNRLTPADRDVLAAAGVVLDVDLRTADEASSAPDLLAQDARFRYTRVSLLGAEKIDLNNMPDTLAQGYVQWLSSNQAQFRQVFQSIAAQQDGTVLFHCTAGKDRTGMIAATLLSLAGVPRSEIVHNYAISAHYLQPMMGDQAQMAASNPQLAEMMRNPKIAAMRGSPPEAIEAFLDAMDRHYGGAHNYLKTIGLSAAEIHNLQVRLGQSH
ncbi:MAG: tyrosine-protein phosphatase [Steroidobacteraceae bacterium]